MSVIWYKVWYDLWHNKLRTMLVVISITVGVFAVGVTFGMVDQMLPAMDSAHIATVPSHGTLNLMQPVDMDTVIALKKLPNVADIDPVNAVEVRYKIHPGDPWKKGSIMMRDYESQVYDLLQLKAGKWPEGKNLSIERMHGPFYGTELLGLMGRFIQRVSRFKGHNIVMVAVQHQQGNLNALYLGERIILHPKCLCRHFEDIDERGERRLQNEPHKLVPAGQIDGDGPAERLPEDDYPIPLDIRARAQVIQSPMRIAVCPILGRPPLAIAVAAIVEDEDINVDPVVQQLQ